MEDVFKRVNIPSKEDFENVIICKTDGEEVQFLNGYNNRNVNYLFKDIDELEFEVYYYVEENNKMIKNECYDNLVNGYLIKVNDVKIFTIDSVSENFDVSGQIIKTVHCNSREFTLSKRFLRNFKGTRQLYRSPLDGYAQRIEYSLNGTDWNLYSTPFEAKEKENIYIRLYDNFESLIAEYVWNSKDVAPNTQGVLVTWEMKNQIDYTINVAIKIIAETGDGILNLLEEQTSWKIGHIDEGARQDWSEGQDHRKYRTFSVSEKSWLDFLREEIQSSFDCVLDFDTINKIINIYHINSVTQDNDFLISNENYLQSLTKNIDDSEVVTRMQIYGKDNMNISRINPTGLLYIEDYSYYKNTKYMEQDLIDALDNYDKLIEENTPTFLDYLKRLSDRRIEKSKIENELVNLKIKLAIAQDNIDIAIEGNKKNTDIPQKIEGGSDSSINPKDEIKVNVSDVDVPLDLSEWNAEKAKVEREISDKESELIAVEIVIEDLLKLIEELKEKIKKSNVFTEKQLGDLDNFVKEEVWTNNNYYTEEDLLEAGKKALKDLINPKITFDIDVIDFLNIAECKNDWKKISKGCKVLLYNKELNVDLYVRVVNISHDIDNNSLSLTLSNLDEIENPTRFLSSIASNSKDTSANMNIFKPTWDLTGENRDLVTNIINSSLDTAKNMVLSGRKQNISITERGISLKHMDSDDRQIRMLNNIIAFTKDNWKTCSTAITADGIVSESLYGKVVGSNKLIITNMNEKGESSFIVDKDSMKATNMSLSLENKAVTNRIYMNPDIGFKIQKKENGTWKDVMFMDMEGNINAVSFKVINTNTKLDNTGLTIDNGAIWIYNKEGQLVFQADQNGEVDATGRFRVLKDLSQPPVDGNVLCDMYKDNNKGGKLLICNWEGWHNVFLGSSPNASYDGGFLQIYNKLGEQRVQAGVFTNDDAGTINLMGDHQVVRARMSAKSGTGDYGCLSLRNQSGDEKVLITAQSDHDNVASSGRQVGGQIEFTSYDGSYKNWISVNQENAFNMANDIGTLELNRRMNAIILAHKSSKANLSLNDDQASIANVRNGDGTMPESYIDLRKDYLNIGFNNNSSLIQFTGNALLIKFNDSNYIKISSSGVKIVGSRIDLN